MHCRVEQGVAGLGSVVVAYSLLLQAAIKLRRLPCSLPEFSYHLQVAAMGIHGLMKLIGDYAPAALREHDIKSYFGACTAAGGN